MDFGPIWESSLGIISNKGELEPQLMSVAAGQRLEGGMLVTCNGPVTMAGAGAKGYTVGVIEWDCDSTEEDKVARVYRSRAIVCVKAGVNIETHHTALKVWDGGTVAPMEEKDPPDLFVGRVRGPTRIGEKWRPIPAGSPVRIIME